jgi:hypothetical protein
MLRVYAIIGAVIVALAGSVWFLIDRNASLRANLVRANTTIAAHVEAAAILNETLRVEQKSRDEWRRKATELERLEGADAPLSAYGRAVFDSVRSTTD